VLCDIQIALSGVKILLCDVKIALCGVQILSLKSVVCSLKAVKWLLSRKWHRGDWDCPFLTFLFRKLKRAEVSLEPVKSAQKKKSFVQVTVGYSVTTRCGL
jgi:hypothetical protein